MLNIDKLSLEQLLVFTQDRVDAHRRLLDDCYQQLIELGVPEESFEHIEAEMIFTGETKAMLDKCADLDLEINTKRTLK